MKTVAIIGAGITGLSAAYRLRQSQVPVTVHEAGGRVGGVIRTLRQEGYLAGYGPNTLLETSPKITELVRELGLAGRRLDSDPRAKNRAHRARAKARQPSRFRSAISGHKTVLGLGQIAAVAGTVHWPGQSRGKRGGVCQTPAGPGVSGLCD